MDKVVVKIIISISMLFYCDVLTNTLISVIGSPEQFPDEFEKYGYFIFNVMIISGAIIIFISGISELYKVMSPYYSSNIEEMSSALFKNSRKLVVLSILKKISTNNNDNFMIENHYVVNPSLDIAAKNFINNYMNNNKNNKSKAKIANDFTKNFVERF